MLRKTCAFLVVAILIVPALATADTVGGAGTLEIIGEGDDTILLVRAQGDRYELGYWYGKLLADHIAASWQIVQAIMGQAGLTEEAFAMAADTLWQADIYDTTPWLREIQGAADGCAAAGHPEITRRVLQLMASVPDVSEYNCSLFAAWGSATVGDATYQMRNLDWAMDTGLEDHVVVAIYQPEDGLKHAVVGFAGILGAAIGGINSEGLAVSEIMGFFCDEETLAGEPFPFILRDILYHDRDLEAAVDRIQQATRTNQYHYAVADPAAADPKARLLFTSHTRFDVYTDNETVSPHPCVDLSPFHEPFDDVLYWKYHNGQENEILHSAIAERYGRIDVEAAKEIARAAGVGHTLVSIIYDNMRREMWIAAAQGMTPAQQRAFVFIRLD